MGGVTVNTVDWTMMLSRVDTEVKGNINFLASLVRLKDVALFGSDQELEGTVFSVVFETGSTENLGYLLSVDVELLFELELVSWSMIEHLHVPPEDSSIS